MSETLTLCDPRFCLRRPFSPYLHAAQSFRVAHAQNERAMHGIDAISTFSGGRPVCSPDDQSETTSFRQIIPCRRLPVAFADAAESGYADSLAARPAALSSAAHARVLNLFTT